MDFDHVLENHFTENIIQYSLQPDGGKATLQIYLHSGNFPMSVAFIFSGNDIKAGEKFASIISLMGFHAILFCYTSPVKENDMADDIPYAVKFVSNHTNDYFFNQKSILLFGIENAGNFPFFLSQKKCNKDFIGAVSNMNGKVKCSYDEGMEFTPYSYFFVSSTLHDSLPIITYCREMYLKGLKYELHLFCDNQNLNIIENDIAHPQWIENLYLWVMAKHFC